MTQYMRLKQKKESGKRMRLHLSMSDGAIPIILCSFFDLHARIGGSATALQATDMSLTPHEAMSRNKQDSNTKSTTIMFVKYY